MKPLEHIVNFNKALEEAAMAVAAEGLNERKIAKLESGRTMTTGLLMSRVARDIQVIQHSVQAAS